jgi:hypothetical protein
MARDIKPVLAKNERASARQIPSVDSIVDLFPGSELDFCSRLGLSRKIGNLASLNELSGGFATLLMALSRQPVANMGADEQKELIEGARTFCLSWYGQREVKPNMAKRNPHIATVNFLVARFLRHDPAYEGQQTGPDLPGEMVRGKTWKAILYQGNRPGKSPTRA